MRARARNFYHGVIAALAVVALHDNKVIFDEIVGTCDERELIRAAVEDESAEWAGLVKYGYLEETR